MILRVLWWVLIAVALIGVAYRDYDYAAVCIGWAVLIDLHIMRAVPPCPTCGHTMAVHHPDGRCGLCIDVERMKWGHH